MFFSVIIPTANRNNLLRKCLNNLMPEFQTIDSTRYEIIVTDDSKSNIEFEILKREFPFVKFIKGPQNGPATNRNNGAKFALGDWLIFIDDDCLPDYNILNAYHNEIIKGEYGAFEGCINADRAQLRYDENSPLNLKGGKFWSCNICINKEIYFSIGGFDECFQFPCLEDTDLYNRLKLVTKINFLENAMVIHPWRRMKKFTNYKKWIVSGQYSLKKNNTNKNIHYRSRRINLFIGSLFLETKKLMKYNLKGKSYYLEVIMFNFLMIFK